MYKKYSYRLDFCIGLLPCGADMFFMLPDKNIIGMKLLSFADKKMESKDGIHGFLAIFAPNNTIILT